MPITEGVFPGALKMAQEIHAFENGVYFNPGNYGPVSLLTSLSKVFEQPFF